MNWSIQDISVLFFVPNEIQNLITKLTYYEFENLSLESGETATGL